MFKKIARYLLTLFGYEIKKLIPKRFQNSTLDTRKPDIQIEVYGKKINVESSHPFTSLYLINPNYNAELGRLVSNISAKYPKLAVIDIGANVGDTLCIIKGAADVPVICVEGDDKLFHYLEINSSQFNNVFLFKAFLGEKNETIVGKTEKEGWNTTIIEAKDLHGKHINIKTLDQILADRPGIDHFKLLKIDTEGYDTKIIRGGNNFLSRVKPVILMEYNRENMDRINEKGFDTLEHLENLGYHQVLVYESKGNFLLSTTLNSEIMFQLHLYAGNRNHSISYFDLCIFHGEDNDIADTFISSEETIAGKVI